MLKKHKQKIIQIALLILLALSLSGCMGGGGLGGCNLGGSTFGLPTWMVMIGIVVFFLWMWKRRGK